MKCEVSGVKNQNCQCGISHLRVDRAKQNASISACNRFALQGKVEERVPTPVLRIQPLWPVRNARWSRGGRDCRGGRPAHLCRHRHRPTPVLSRLLLAVLTVPCYFRLVLIAPGYIWLVLIVPSYFWLVLIVHCPSPWKNLSLGSGDTCSRQTRTTHGKMRLTRPPCATSSDFEFERLRVMPRLLQSASLLMNAL